MSLNRNRVLNQLINLNEYEFEYLVADLWEKRGWNTKVTQGSNDRGIDIIAKNSNPFPQKHLIQAKRYARDNKIGSPDIQQYSSLQHQEENVDAVVIVTTTSFSSPAKETAEDLNVKLIDGSALYNMLVKTGAEKILEDYIYLEKPESGSEPPEKDDNTSSLESESSPFEDESSFSRIRSGQQYVNSCPNCDDGTVWIGVRKDSRFLKCKECSTIWGTKKSTDSFDKWTRIPSTDVDLSSISPDKNTPDNESKNSPFEDESSFSRILPNQLYVDGCPNCDDGTVWFGAQSDGRYLKCEKCYTTWGIDKSKEKKPFEEWTEISGINRALPNNSAVSEDDSDPCFIATAAYGSPQEEEIDRLRKFRDDVLLPNRVGEVLVLIYYRTSPPIANWIARSEQRRRIIRNFVIKPLLWIVENSFQLGKT